MIKIELIKKSSEVKAKIWDKSDGFCWYCGNRLNPFRNFSIDRLIPKLQTIENPVPCCKSCNSQRGDKTIEDLRRSKLKKQGMGFSEEQKQFLQKNCVDIGDLSWGYTFWFEEFEKIGVIGDKKIEGRKVERK